MIIDQDIVQRIKVFGIFTLQFYKVLTGTMLTLFIPQACPDTSDSSGEISMRICTISENFENNEKMS